MYELLSRLSVIEASSFVASPTAGLSCAQFGAEVIRVDQIADDPIFGRPANPSGLRHPAAGPFGSIPQAGRESPRPAPRNGEHSEEILSQRLSLPAGEIARLIDTGVVGIAAPGRG